MFVPLMLICYLITTPLGCLKVPRRVPLNRSRLLYVPERVPLNLFRLPYVPERVPLNLFRLPYVPERVPLNRLTNPYACRVLASICKFLAFYLGEENNFLVQGMAEELFAAHKEKQIVDVLEVKDEEVMVAALECMNSIPIGFITKETVGLLLQLLQRLPYPHAGSIALSPPPPLLSPFAAAAAVSFACCLLRLLSPLLSPSGTVSFPVSPLCRRC
ncbi:hypothetical protein EBH_0023850 [Eimeria brunetti]|uniref:Uncharacterized protein n=1 Tax=Eimeria brunetti TaxID=51314 RepID=U6LIK8_9EIME|nr:hypothetical protein EBH_0023850 [Eimeria brunetti]